MEEFKENRFRLSSSFCFHLVFCLLIFLSPFFSRWWGILPVGLSVIYIVLFGFNCFQGKSFDFRIRNLKIQPIFIFITAALAYVFASYFWSFQPDYSAKRLIKLSILALAAAVIYLTVRRDNLFLNKAPDRLYIFSFAIGLSLLLFEVLSDLQITKYFVTDKKIKGSDLNPGAAIYAIAIWPLLFLMIKKGYSKLYAWGGYALTCAVLFLTDSQASQLAMVSAGFIFLCVYFFRNLALKFYFGAISVTLFAAPFLYPLLRDFWPSSLNEHVRTATLVRLDIWSEFSRLSLNAPFFGHGVGTSRFAVLDPSKQIYNVYYDTVLHPHSAILQTWYELGLVGVLFLGGMIGYVFYAAIKMQNTIDKAVSVSLLTAMGAIALVGYGMWQGWLIGCCFMAAILFIRGLKAEGSHTIY